MWKVSLDSKPDHWCFAELHVDCTVIDHDLYLPRRYLPVNILGEELLWAVQVCCHHPCYTTPKLIGPVGVISAWYFISMTLSSANDRTAYSELIA